MEGASASKFSVLLQSQRPPSQPLDAFFLPAASSPSFLGSRSMMSFEDANGSTRPFFRPFELEDNDENEFEEYFQQPEKKRRLTLDQVQFLEKSFEVENKLEPDRKVQLARDLGLQPRQVAIWFQNRRARWKTKQLEKDYDALLNSYNTLKADCDTLVKDTDKLKSEVNLLTEKLKGNSESCNKDTASQEQPDKPVSDAESPHYTDGVHSLTGDSSYVFEAEQSDLSQDEEDNLTKSYFPPYVFPKLEDVNYSDDPPAGFEDQTFWTWSF